MLKFIKNVFLFVVIFFIYDKLFIIVALLSPQTEIDKRLELLINGDINKDIIILGSSRGARDIIAAQIENKTGLSAYNLCYPGTSIEYHEFVLRTLVKYNTPPKLVLFVVDDDIELITNEITSFRYDRLYPLIKYPYIKEELINRGEINKYISRLFILYQMNLRNLDLRNKEFSSIDSILFCGSMPLSFQREGREWKFKSGERVYPNNEEDKNKVIAFKSCMKLLDQNKIKTVIVFPPNFQSHSIPFENRIRELCEDKVMYYIYNRDKTEYLDKDNYYDEGHLSLKGAKIFTSEIIQYLKEKINI